MALYHSIRKAVISTAALFTALSLTVTSYADSFPQQNTAQAAGYSGDVSIIDSVMGEPYILSQKFVPFSEAEDPEEAEVRSAEAAYASGASEKDTSVSEPSLSAGGQNSGTVTDKSKAYSDGNNDGKSGKPLNEKYSSDQDIMKSYREGYEQGSRQAKQDESLKLTSAKYDWTASQTFDFVKEQKVVAIPDKGLDMKLTCTVSGDSSRVSDYVIYGKLPGKDEFKELARSSNGTLEFKLTKDYLPDKSGNSARFKVTVTDKDKKWYDTDLNIKVKEGGGNELEIKAGADKPLSIKIPDGVPYLGNSELNLNDFSLPIYAVMMSDGTVRAGVNLKKDLLKEGSDLNNFKDFKKKFGEMKDKMGDNIEKSFEAFSNYLDQPKRKVGSLGKMKPDFGFDFNLMGYGEGKIGDSGLDYVSMNVILGLTVKCEFGWQFVVWVIPVTVEVTITGKVSAKFEIKLDFNKKDVTGNIDIEASIKLEGFVGIGLRKIVTAGAYGVAKATLNVKLMPSNDAGVTKFAINGGFGIKLSLLCFSYEKLFVEKEYVIYQRENKNAAKPMLTSFRGNIYADIYNEDNYTLMTEEFPSNLVGGEDGDILISQVYPGADPSFESLGGNNILVSYLSTVPDRNKTNRLAVYYIYYDSETGKWTAPEIADKNATLDGIHNLYNDGTNAYLVYTSSDTALPEDADISSVTPHMGLYVRNFDKETKKFGEAAKLSENGKYVSDIAMNTVNGVPTLIWVQSSNPKAFGNHNENEIAVSRFKDGKWSEPELVVTGSSCIGDVTVGTIGGEEKILYFYDNDNDPSTYDDYTLTYAGGGVLATGMISYLNFVDLPYGRYPIWFENGCIMQLTESGKSVIADGVGYASDLESNGSVIYYVKETDDGGSAVYGLRYIGDKYSEPFTVVRSKGEIRDLDTSGNSILYTESISNIESATEESGLTDVSSIKLKEKDDFWYSVELKDVEVVTEEMIPGEDADIDLTVFNDSSNILSNFGVTFTDAEGNTVHSEDVECGIGPGETAVVRVRLPVPEKLKDLPVSVKISGIKDNTGMIDSNKKAVDMSSYELSVGAGSVIIDGESMFEVTVTNDSRLETSARIEITDMEGNPVHTEKTDTLGGKEEKTVYIDPALLLPEGEDFGIVNVNVYVNDSAFVSDSVCEYVMGEEPAELHSVMFYDTDLNLLSEQYIEDGDNADTDEFPKRSRYYDLIADRMMSALPAVTEDKYYMVLGAELPHIDPGYVPSGTGSTPAGTAETSSSAVDITKYGISGSMSADNSSSLKWDAVPDAGGYSLYIKADGKYAFVRDLGKSTAADIVLGYNGRYYVSAGGDYTVYKYSSKTGKFTKSGTLAADKIGGIARANNVTIDYMVKYTVNGKESAEKDSYKVSVKIYYKPAVRISSEKKDGKSSITLRWDKVPGAGKYKVYRYVNGRLKPVAETSKTAVRIGGVKSGKEYTYAVKAYAGGRWTKLNTADIVSIKAR